MSYKTHDPLVERVISNKVYQLRFNGNIEIYTLGAGGSSIPTVIQKADVRDILDFLLECNYHIAGVE